MATWVCCRLQRGAYLMIAAVLPRDHVGAEGRARKCISEVEGLVGNRVQIQHSVLWPCEAMACILWTTELSAQMCVKVTQNKVRVTVHAFLILYSCPSGGGAFLQRIPCVHSGLPSTLTAVRVTRRTRYGPFHLGESEIFSNDLIMT